MQFIAHDLILSPSDLVDSVLCDHLVTLDLAAARGDLPLPASNNPAAELVARRGDEHERRYLDLLIAQGLNVAEIPSADRDADGLRRAEAGTLAAMRSGADVIYQATFFDGRWRGHADFLERVDRPSDLGDFSYEVADTKLARHVKVGALLQTCSYSEHVARLQGVEPEQVHIVLGDLSRRSFPLSDMSAYFRAMKRRFEQTVDEAIGRLTYPEPVSHCDICRWADRCNDQRRTDDHLSLVAGMRRDQVQKLQEQGVATVAALAETTIGAVSGIGGATFERLHEQALLQIQQRKSGGVHYELLEAGNDNRGLARLPEPSPGDLFFDMEGDPFIPDNGREYLFGVVELDGATPLYHSHWGNTDTDEKHAFEQFIDFVMAKLQAHPALHIFHYAPYEPTALKKVAGRHGTREAELDCLLRGEVFVDLYRVVRQGLRISQESYSIKKLEPLYMPEGRETDVAGGAESIVAYEAWLESGDDAILADIEAYNRDDCESTLLLRNWLEERRTEAIERCGPIPRPVPQALEPSEAVSDLETRVDLLRDALCSTAAAGSTEPEDHARWLLAQLLQWHRRERKSEWWRYYELLDMTDDELIEDREALAALTYEGVVDTVARSFVHRYRFDPSQEHKVGVGSRPVDPRTKRDVGEVFAIDNDEGFIDLKRAKTSDRPHPAALVPPGARGSSGQQDALLEIAQCVVDQELDSQSANACGLDLLRRRPPRLQNGRDIEAVVNEASDPTTAAIELVTNLETTTLAVQGPPGSGKTYAGAEMVIALVRAGKRVGITATSHKVIGNFLATVHKHAAKSETRIRMLQKAGEDNRCHVPNVQCTDDNAVVEQALASGSVDVVAGTSWLFSRPVLRDSLDVLIVDEAGQMSLADALAVSTAARSLVLLGDPQQLAQPSKGVHPPGAEQSALGHFLGDHHTMPADLGLLLDRTWRMHPDVCSFVSEAFYDSRLHCEDSCRNQAVTGSDVWAGTGLRYVPVAHRGNRTSSPEEAAAVTTAMKDLVGRDWQAADGSTRSLTLDDILVVAPYNAQVTCLRDALPSGARIGTVDKFQGQEGTVVFYSLAASTPEDISRGMEFLYSANRFNVAVSRARCLAVVVCSPDLLTINCRTPDQVRLANGLCSFIERATAVV